jgi:SAM-dependent methyltransferase
MAAYLIQSLKWIYLGATMPDLNWNKDVWGRSYNWTEGGEEWSTAWGGSEAQWFGAIYPRLHRFLPARRILEVAPGFGRWTKYLLPACEDFVGIDLSEKCINACRNRFSNVRHARFFTNDGHSLEAAQDKVFDLIFSFDSLVHAEYPVLATYIPQVLHKLSSVGVAFIHHSNLLAYHNTIGPQHGRAMTVSADAVADLIYRGGGTVLIQEIVNWGGEHLIDCLTLFSRHETYPSVKAVRHKNPLFMAEATLIKGFQSPYSKLFDEQSKSDGRSNNSEVAA